MSRLHPFDFVFADLADLRFDGIRTEAPRGPDCPLTAFAKLPSVQSLLQEIQPPNPDAVDPETVTEYLTLLFAAYRFWEAGRRTVEVERSSLSARLADTPRGALTVPADACYIRFPSPWFWATIEEGRPHEPIEGVFVVRSRAPAELTFAAVLGLRKDREGFSQITVHATPDEVAAAAPDRSPPFGPVMAGGEAAGFCSVVSEGELVRLVHLALDSAPQ